MAVEALTSQAQQGSAGGCSQSNAARHEYGGSPFFNFFNFYFKDEDEIMP